MPVAKVQMPDGRVAKFEVPDGTTPEQVTEFATKHFAGAAPGREQGFVANLADGAKKYVTDQVLAAEQRAAQAGEIKNPNARIAATPSLFDQAVNIFKGGRSAVDVQAEIDQKAKDDAPLMRTWGGNIGNAAIPIVAGVLSGGRSAPSAAAAAPALARIGKTMVAGAEVGGLQGAVSGANRPVLTGETRGGNAASGAVAGAVSGAVLTPAFGELSRGLSRLASGLRGRMRSEADVQQAAYKAVDDWLASSQSQGYDLADIPASMIQGIKAKAVDALKTGKQLDPAALMRAADFEAVGVKPTLGQVTRNPMQYARERNLRGVDVGGGQNALSQRFAEQGSALQSRIAQLGASSADEADVAGNKLISALQRYDEPRKQAVAQAYRTARDASGRYADVDVPAFSNAANNALDEQMLGRFLPDDVRGLLNDVSTGRIPLNVNNLVQTDSVMSAAQRAAKARGDGAAEKAIGVVRNALNDALILGDDTAKAAFDSARGLARQRFAGIEATPALKAALDHADPDKFVNKYVVGGTTADLNALRGAVANDPEAVSVVRSQIAAYLQKKAFGANAAGDKPFAQESYNAALKQLGTNKLLAFFSPEEVNQMKAVGRVASYIHSQPEGAAVNNSNTGSAVANLFGELTGKIGQFPGANVLRNSFRDFQNERAIGNALSDNLFENAVPVQPQLFNALASPAPVFAGHNAGQRQK